MLSRPQIILLKRAQAEAALDDSDYRAAIETVSGIADCRSSKDSRLTDRHLDNLLAYFEAIHWRKVDSGALQPSCKPNAVFRQRGFWVAKNKRGNTSRDRFAEKTWRERVTVLENELYELGFGLAYIQAIQNKIKPFSLTKYYGALKRTLDSKKAKLADQPY